MKRVIALILSALLLAAFCGCKKTPQYAPDPEETEKVTVEELLPDWQAIEKDGWYYYKDVTPQMVRDFTDRRAAEGFTLLENEEGKWGKMLYRGDAWINISDNAESEKNCSMQVIRRTHDGGMGAQEAFALISAEVAANTRPWTNTADAPRNLAAVLEISPEGFYEATGAQVFRALFDGSPYKDSKDLAFSEATFICARKGALEVRSFSAAAADIDGDGANEAITIGYGYGSGVVDFIFESFGIKNGELVSEARTVYTMKFGKISLTARGGKPYMVWEKQVEHPGEDVTFDDPVEFELLVENGDVQINDPDNLLKALVSGSAYFN